VSVLDGAHPQPLPMLQRPRSPGGLGRVPSMSPAMDPIAERLGTQARLGDQRVPFLSDLIVGWPLAPFDAIEFI
jgi:hypothetical protein